MIVFDFGFEKKQSTYSDYLKTPEGGKFQLIGGEIIEMTSPSLYHQEILLNLVSEFRNFLLKNRVGKVFVAPSDVHFTDTETYQPDILISINRKFFLRCKKNKIEGSSRFNCRSSLSPSTAYYDLKTQEKPSMKKHGSQRNTG
jgi:hypothetical protein